LPIAGKGKVIASEVSTFQMIILVASLAVSKGGISFDFSRTRVAFSFLVGKTELLVLLLKKSRISLFSRDASGKTD
jgi:hypothetical protein